MQPHDPLALVLLCVSTLSGVGGLGTALAVYLRAGGWRDRDATKIEIKQVDQGARDNICKVESEAEARADRLDAAMRTNLAAVYQDMHAADGDTRQALQKIESELRNSMRDQGLEISQIKENVRHLPTTADISNLREDVSELKAGQAELRAKLGGLSDLMTRMDRTLTRLEDHMMAAAK